MSAAISERDLTAYVRDVAKTFGWRVAHFRAARTAHGWRTPVAADGAGFPDEVLVRPPRIIFAELKSDRGKLSPDQQAWLAALSEVPGVEVYVWSPAQMDEIAQVLR